jgi:16S rRNA (cytosine1402-N4)-methyltransferase
LPITHVQSNAKLREIGKKLRPSEAEIKRNPRARSATMRVAERLS